MLASSEAGIPLPQRSAARKEGSVQIQHYRTEAARLGLKDFTFYPEEPMCPQNTIYRRYAFDDHCFDSLTSAVDYLRSAGFTLREAVDYCHALPEVSFCF